MKLLLTGGSGMLGSRILELYKDAHEIIAPSHTELDITKVESIEQAIKGANPDALINCAAYTNVDGAEEDHDIDAHILNAIAPRNLGIACKKNGVRLVHVSTDYVFDGKQQGPCIEYGMKNPVNWYGKTKLHGERDIGWSGCYHAIARISMPYTAHFDRKHDFARFFLKTLREGKEIQAPSDQNITPVFLDSAADAVMKLTTEKHYGVYHVASSDYTTPYLFAKRIAQVFGLDAGLVKATSFARLNANRKAARPQDTWLDTSAFRYNIDHGSSTLITNEEGIRRFKAQDP